MEMKGCGTQNTENRDTDTTCLQTAISEIPHCQHSVILGCAWFGLQRRLVI